MIWKTIKQFFSDKVLNSLCGRTTGIGVTQTFIYCLRCHRVSYVRSI